MCGIAGFFGVLNSPEAVKSSLASLALRGPDGSGVFEAKDGTLIHTRLAIIDLSVQANQPFLSEDGAFALVFNGEIYNYQELRRKLEAEGHHFRTNSDTEVLLKGLIAHQESFLPLLRGMFAFALYDKRTDEIFIARDQLGIKPLYYTSTDEGLAFASNKKTLLQALPSYFSLDWSNLALGVPFGGCPQPFTVWDRMKAIPAGHWMKWKRGEKARFYQWWDLPSEQAIVETRSESFDALLESSVREHLVSDVSVGLMLSGGLDSTLLSSYLRGTDVTAFTIEDSTDPTESVRARLVAKTFGLRHEVIQHEDIDPVSSLKQTVSVNEEPMPYLDPQLLMARTLGRHGVKVALNGLGPDEEMSGYRYHRLLQRPWTMAWMGMDLTKLSDHKAFKLLAIKDEWDFYMNFHFRAQFSPESVFRPAINESFAGSFEKLKSVYSKKYSSPMRMVNYLDHKIGLGTHHLHTADQFFMEYSIEGRFPYLDHRILEWAFALPDAEKRKGKESKIALRKLAVSKLPAELLNAPKRGFNHPDPVSYQGDEYLVHCLHAVPKDVIQGPAKLAALAFVNGQGSASPTAMYVTQLAVWLDQVKSLHVRL